jgi:GTPase
VIPLTEDKNKTNYKSGYIALIGKPNVGKSTLMNALLGLKLSIVTPKPQTTRHRILGILNEEKTQMIFLDTPGLLKPRYKLQDKMLHAVKRAMEEADVMLILVEPLEKIHDEIRSIFVSLKVSQKPVILLINKIDTVEKKKLLPIIDRFAATFDFTKIIPISALKQEGLSELKICLTENLPQGFPLYPEDMVTEHPERFFVSEIIREKIFQNYGDEIPYSTTVLIEEFKEREGRKDFIRANIIVEKDSQKGILIGKKGAALKKVGSTARYQIEQFLGRKVYLELFVKVREKWRKKDAFLKEFGYG